VQVVCGEEQAVRDPIAASEGALHAREEEASKQELLTNDGEHHQRKDEGVPAPGTGQERLTGIRSDERGELPVLGRCEGRDELLRRYERQDQRDHDQPDPAADPSAAGASGGAKPERLADRRPAERPLLAADEDRDENELPDETEIKTHDQCLEHRHNAVAGEPVLERGRDEPGERCHRHRCGRPDGEDPAVPQLWNLDTRGASVGAGSGRGWKCVVHLDHPFAA
jgi:hypothetical protein